MTAVSPSPGTRSQRLLTGKNEPGRLGKVSHLQHSESSRKKSGAGVTTEDWRKDLHRPCSFGLSLHLVHPGDRGGDTEATISKAYLRENLSLQAKLSKNQCLEFGPAPGSRPQIPSRKVPLEAI